MAAGGVLLKITLLEGTSSEIIVRERVLGLTERVASGKERALRFVFSFLQFNNPILHPPGNMAPLMLDSAFQSECLVPWGGASRRCRDSGVKNVLLLGVEEES